MKPTLAALSIAAAIGLAGPAFAADLTLAFTGIETPKGVLMVALLDSEAAYQGEGQPVRALRLDVNGPTASTVVKDLAPGRYAIKMFHDIDGDGALQTNPFGSPIEPYAFSNNAPAHLGPPAWAKASFDLPEQGASQTISVR